LTVQTQLSDVMEVSSDEGHTSCSSSSSDASMDFAEHRGFVKPLPVRRPGFLDDDDKSSCSSSSSDASIDYAEHRAFVRAMPVRRFGFLDDKASDNDLEVRLPPATPNFPVVWPPISRPASPVVEHIIECLKNTIWHQEVDLFIVRPLTPVEA
jgi:hypothetical protein